MIFQKSTPKNTVDEEMTQFDAPADAERVDEIETVVGPSVNVEGDFASEGNIIIKGTVSGSVHTSRFLFVEQGAKIMANVRAGTAKISGDIECRVLSVEPGALLFGKISMPGIEGAETRSTKPRNSRRADESTEAGE